MSWSLRFEGPKDEVVGKAGEEFDRIARNYDGQMEALEVMACKERAIAALRELDHFGPDAFAPKGYVAQVYAYGSHSTGYGCSFNVTVDRKKLE